MRQRGSGFGPPSTLNPNAGGWWAPTCNGLLAGLLGLGLAFAGDASAADLAVAATVGPLSPAGKLTYTTIVKNMSATAATGVVFTQTVPVGVINVSAAPPSCVFSAAGDMVTCSLGTLAGGASTTAAVVVHPITVGAKSSTAKVTATTADPNLANNTATASITISEVAISNMAVVGITDGPDPLRVGANLTYTITVRNLGDDDAQDVLLLDALPVGAAYVTASASQGGCGLSGGVVICKLGRFGVGGVATVRIVVRPGVAGIMYNTVGIALSTVDPNVANNSATIASWVNP